MKTELGIENLLDRLWFRLVLVAASSLYVTEIGSMDSLATRLRTMDFYKEYLATILISISVVELVHFVHKHLEKKVAWHNQVLYRLVLQAIFGWFIPLVVVFVLAAVYFYIYGVDIMRTDYLYYSFPFVVVLILLLNIVFIMTPYFLLGFQHLKEKQALAPQKEHEAQILQPIKVQDGNSVLILEPQEILSAYIVNGKVIIRNHEHNEFLTSLTLDELENDYLPTKSFFRINRQLIVCRDIVKSYRPLDYGKIDVELTFSVPVNLVVSQLKAKTFKEWLS